MNISKNIQCEVTPPPFPLVEMGKAGGGRTPGEKERVKREIEDDRHLL